MSDMREAIEAAFEQHTESQPGQEPTAVESPPSEPSSPSPSEADTTTPVPAGEPVRDALGRFVKQTPDIKPEAQPKAAQAPQTPLEQPQERPATATYEKPPRGVPIPLRSHWSGLSPEWRTHITEVHGAVQKAQQEAQPSIDFTGRFLQAIQPYQQAIQIETGGDPMKAVVGLMDTASRLRFGTPQEKAGIISHLISTYGVDIQTLDSVLAGQAPPPGQQGFDPSLIRREVQQALNPLMQAAQQRRAQQEQQVMRDVEREMQAFAADPKHEFYDDVREIMADVLEIADRQNLNISLEDAYTRACHLHPQIGQTMLARQQGQTAQNLTQAAQRAKAAAVSVKGAAPVGNPEPTAPTSVRQAIEQAMEAHRV